MQYKDEKQDIPGQWSLILRKGVIITLSGILLACLTFITVSVARVKGQEYQQVIQIEDVEQTKQQIKKEEPQKAKIAEVIASEDEDIPDTVTIGTTDLNVDSYVPPPPSDDDNVVEFFALENPPQAKKRVEPEYPSLAEKGQVEGVVMVEVIIETDGSVKIAKVIDADPKGFFEDAALKAAKQWVFEPAKQRDKPVRVRYQIPFRFKLRN
jgi:periplasmic protein TonB